MDSIWRDIVIKKGAGGAGRVTDEEKDAVITRAVSTWKRMGLTQEQIAFGIATMNVESGFNPAAKYPGPESTAYGLGQFTDPTWPDAVKYYNKHFRDLFGEEIYPDVSREDADAQIKVMGAWIDKAWKRALRIADDPRLEDYSLIEISYGLWHQGVYADVDGDEKSLKHYLDSYFSNSATDRFLNNTYIKADDALDVADILHEGGIRAPSREIIRRFIRFHGGLPSGESLMRDKVDYTIVHRIEPDGGTRGYFISE